MVRRYCLCIWEGSSLTALGCDPSAISCSPQVTLHRLGDFIGSEPSLHEFSSAWTLFSGAVSLKAMTEDLSTLLAVAAQHVRRAINA